MKIILFLITISVIFSSTYAEYIVGNSAEWISHESEVIILAVPIEVENIKGQGEVWITKTQFKIDEVIKGALSKGDAMTIYDFSYNKQDSLSLAKAKKDSKQLLIYVAVAKGTFEEIDGKYIFTRVHQFKSAFYIDQPVNNLFTPEFKLLNKFEELLERTRKQVKYELELKRRNWEGTIEKNESEAPKNSEAGQKLFAGSSCAVAVPEYKEKTKSK